MPDVQHSSLTGAELHEPKGISGASSNETYVANGAGSGSWAEPEPKGVSGATSGQAYIANGAGSGAWTSLFQYGGIHNFESDTVSISTIGTTPQTFPFASNGPDNGVVADSANNRVTCTLAGDYFVIFSATVATVAAGDAGLYEFKLRDDGTETGHAAAIQLSGTSDEAVVSFGAIITVGAGSHITITVESDEAGNTDDLNVYYAGLKVIKVS